MSNRTWKGLAAGALAVGVAVAGVVPTASAASPTSPPPPPRDVGIVDRSVPAAVRVGSPLSSFTLTVVTGEVVDEVDVSLLDDRGGRVGGGRATAPAAGRPPTFFKPRVDARTADLTSWGDHQVVVEGRRVDDDVVATGTFWTDLRKHSMLGLTVTPESTGTKIRGSLRVYDPAGDRYVAWTSQTVSIQHLVGDRWIHLIGATADRRGNFATDGPAVPAGSRLRAVIHDTPIVWGAVSTVLVTG